MLREQDGTPDGLRRIINEQVIAALEKSGARNLVCLPKSVCETPGPNAEQIERHQFSELCFCLRGRAEMWLDNELAVSEENQLLVIPSGAPHSAAALHCVTSAPDDVFSRLLWISVFPFGAVVNVCESAYGVHRGTARQVFLSHHSQSCLEQIQAELNGPRAGGELMIKYAFMQMMVGLWRGQAARSDSLIESELDAPVATAEARTSLSERVIHHIRRCYYQPGLGLDGVARAVNSNKSHLSRQFKRETGMTVTEYLHKVRIDAAKRLLLAGLHVSAVAEYVGFADAYCFSRVFSQVAGCSPTAYRARGRKRRPRSKTTRTKAR